jgi:hypothetical protein
MVDATLAGMNAEILKYQTFSQEMGDTRIIPSIPSSSGEKCKILSDELLFESENIHLFLTFNATIKKVKCVIYVTEIEGEFVEKMISQVGLPVTEANIQNYRRDPTLVEKFWNEAFIKKYIELLKYLRKSKMTYQFQEKFKPVLNKNRNNEIVDNFG